MRLELKTATVIENMSAKIRYARSGEGVYVRPPTHKYMLCKLEKFYDDERCLIVVEFEERFHFGVCFNKQILIKNEINHLQLYM